VGILFRLAELLLILVPLAGALYAGWRTFRRVGGPRDEVPGDDAPAARPLPDADADAGRDRTVLWRTIVRTVEEHDRIDARWLDYELDAAKLLDFPLMTDVGDPKVMAFHKAKLRADLLRPARAEDLLDDRQSAGEYLSAVEDYVTAFNAAEAEAQRLRRSDFSREAQQRMSRAQNLLRVAADPSATPGERAQSLELADRELEGLVVLPQATRLGIERGIAGELGR
jgi:hypothetical protein